MAAQNISLIIIDDDLIRDDANSNTNDMTQKLINDRDDDLETELSDKDVCLLIGSHIGKGKKENLSTTIGSFCLSRRHKIPAQMFLRSPMSGAGSVLTDSEIEDTCSLIKEHGIGYYTHAAYIINLSNPFPKKNPNSSTWVMGLLTGDLDITSILGGKGVIVHVGKSVKMDVKKALDNMELYIRQALQHASEDCPLLLETAAGQGTELCKKLEDLSDFYNRFSTEDKKRFKICVDTCHVFAAGYDPLFFLREWEKRHPNSIGLVHFNDSKEECGSRKDRHSYYLNPDGKIGFEKLIKVARWCIFHNIDMVTE